MPDVVQRGKLVTLTYSIADDQDNVVEQNDLPLSFVYGGDTELIGGVDEAILGRQAGDEVTVELPAGQAFGAHDPALTFTDDLANVPPQFRHLGAEVQMTNDAGEQRTFYVTRIEDGQLTVDGNHPLAGKALRVRLKIHEVRDATPEDALNSGIHAVSRMMN
jgi:FKBP-type peptidyl-prolyl cis-trans isomerase SlyD